MTAATSTDPYGQMLLDAWRAGPRPGTHFQVIERDDGVISVEDSWRYFTPPGEWPEAERIAVEQARGRILDVGCGAGRHATVMAERGCEVVGIDPSPGAVQVARERGVNARLGATPHLSEVGQFDTIVLLGGNLGLLGSSEQAPAVLDSLRRAARSGAVLLGVGHHPYMTDLPEHRRLHYRNEEAGRMPGQVRMRVRYRGWWSDWFNRLLVSPDQLGDLVVGSGWRVKTCTEPDGRGFFLAKMTC